MDKVCEVCGENAKYKCPKCYINYCSIPCCKKHKEIKCEDRTSSNNNQNDLKSEKKELHYSSGVPKDKLEMLDNDKELGDLLANKHLRDLLEVIDKAENAEEIMQKAMQEPIFVEFADSCLRIVDPASDDKD